MDKKNWFIEYRRYEKANLHSLLKAYSDLHLWMNLSGISQGIIRLEIYQGAFIMGSDKDKSIKAEIKVSGYAGKKQRKAVGAILDYVYSAALAVAKDECEYDELPF